MKLIRLTDDRYVLDAGPDVTSQKFEALQAFFEDWWKTHDERPMQITLGGLTEPLVYEDHRTSDLEARVERLERHIHFTEIDHGWTRGPNEPIVRHEP